MKNLLLFISIYLDNKILIFETSPEMDLISLRNLITTSFCVETTIIKVEPTKNLKFISDSKYHEIIYPLYAPDYLKTKDLNLICIKDKIQNPIL